MSDDAVASPRGGFRWTPEWRAKLPVVRGIHAPRTTGAPSQLRTLLLPPWSNNEEQVLAMGYAAGRSWTSWGEHWRSHVTTTALSQPDMELWLRLYARAVLDADTYKQAVIQQGVLLHGPAFMLEVALQLCAASLEVLGKQRPDDLGVLRQVLACAAEPDYQSALAVARRVRHRNHATRVACAHLFAHLESWAVECVQLGIEDPGALLSTCVLPLSVALEYFDRHATLELKDHFAAVLLQLYLYDAAALPLLERFLARSPDAASTHALLTVLVNVRAPQMLHVLARHLDKKHVLVELQKHAWQHPAAVLGAIIEHTPPDRPRAVQGWLVQLALQESSACSNALATLPAAQREPFQAHLSALEAEQAPPTALPAVLLELPGQGPCVLPRFFVAPAFSRPRLRSGGALPFAAVEQLGRLLCNSYRHTPHPGLASVRQACTSESLADFGWDLLEAWQEAGAPRNESWALTALRVLGDDRTTRRLAAQIHAWCSTSSFEAASKAVSVLCAMGSDLALLYLNDMACKCELTALQLHARLRLLGLAQPHEMQPEDLIDNLVLDLGLDRSGVLELDLGGRRVQVEIDETLEPLIHDRHGARLRDLPAPLPGDDAALTATATARYRKLQQDVACLAALQVARFEQAMIDQRRWTEPQFIRCILNHPLLRQLAARLVWGVYSDAVLVDACRITEDWSLADHRDRGCALAPNVRLGIAHPLDLPAQLQTAFSALFVEYEIPQPFMQLGREVFKATAEELQSNAITRFEGRRVTRQSFMGLIQHGWGRDTDDHVRSVEKLIGACRVSLQLERGYGIKDSSRQLTLAALQIQPYMEGAGKDAGLIFASNRRQTMAALLASKMQQNPEGGAADLTFAQLDAIRLSEVLRDIEMMAPGT